jgi:pentatricopeptide repeat protein|eukprot:TRINITY_DN35208_c1_g1_i1.p1 TRINITY_DN35208_c1_g1~~TRINITY_DN35208_c1_g1_i1.p1  ORF type:complete len:1129 (+),score=198.05 TRINITY_DN35208_c1_g1_i1:207-3593(+)
MIGVTNVPDVDYVVSTLWDVLAGTRVELALFAAAVVTYVALFSDLLPRSAKTSGRSKAKTVIDSDDDVDHTTRTQFRAPFHGTDAGSHGVHDHRSADHQVVLRQWKAMQTRKRGITVPLSRAVEAMQLLKKDTKFILQELRDFLSWQEKDDALFAVNELLDALAKRTDSDMMEVVVALFPEAGLTWDARTYEAFLSMRFTLRHFAEVNALVSEMKGKKIPLTSRSTITIFKTALKTGDFEQARLHFRELKATWAAHANSPSTASHHLAAQFVELACKEHQLRELIPELVEAPLPIEAVNTMLQECVRKRDPSLTHMVEQLARAHDVPFSERAYSLLLKGFVDDGAHGQRILKEALDTFAEITSTDLAAAAIGTCGQRFEPALVARVRRSIRDVQAPAFTAFVRMYVEHEMFDEVCNIYQEQIARSNDDGGRPLCFDARTERIVLDSALKCGRTTLARKLLDASPSSVAKHITMIRKYASEGNLKGAVDIFETLRRNVTDMNSIIYNSIIDACVECRDMSAAKYWMDQTRKAGMVDVASYNTLIKAHLAEGSFDTARSLVKDMQREGIQANRVTYNELLNASVMEATRAGRGGRAANKRVWDLVEEMRAAGVSPNQITCSIMMKSLNSSSDEKDIVRTMDMITTMEDPVDEVLLSSVVEACVRVGKPELVAAKIKEFLRKEGVAVTGSHTFGSIIKAHGFAKDIDAVWSCWKEMRSRHIRPSSVTLGCMVEAVVNNGDPEGAYELITQLQEDDTCRDVVNSVVYCSVLKGFTREKNLDRVLVVYEEMRTRKIDLSAITYNTLIDACARCERMDRVPALLDDMTALGVAPNVITYSTMIKGHCQSGELPSALALLRRMKSETRLKPDEIMYNSLLDGCAQGSHVDEGLRILAEMQREGVPPSNFTLSVLVKLMSRSRRLDRAFEVVEEMSTKYHIRLNVHVFTNLIQACVSNRDPIRAMQVLAQMLAEGIHPDNRTFTILIRMSLQYDLPEQAAGLLRAALGLPDVPELSGIHPKSNMICDRLDYSLVNEALQGLAENKELVIPLFGDIRQHKPNIRIEASTHHRIMMPVGAAPQHSATGGPGFKSSWRGNNGGSGMRGRRGGGGGVTGGAGAGTGHRDSNLNSSRRCRE